MAVAAPRGRADRDEHGIGVAHRRCEIGGEGQPARATLVGDQSRRGPGSKIGISPRFSAAILSASLSTQVT